MQEETAGHIFKMMYFNFVIRGICETEINASVLYVALSKGIKHCFGKGSLAYMVNCLTVPAKTKQNTSLEDGERNAMRQTLDYTPANVLMLRLSSRQQPQ